VSLSCKTNAIYSSEPIAFIDEITLDNRDIVTTESVNFVNLHRHRTIDKDIYAGSSVSLVNSSVNGIFEAGGHVTLLDSKVYEKIRVDADINAFECKYLGDIFAKNQSVNLIKCDKINSVLALQVTLFQSFVKGTVETEQAMVINSEIEGALICYSNYLMIKGSSFINTINVKNPCYRQSAGNGSVESIELSKNRKSPTVELKGTSSVRDVFFKEENNPGTVILRDNATLQGKITNGKLQDCRPIEWD
jgi:hypothetical protein